MEDQFPVFKLSIQGDTQIRLVLGLDGLLIDTTLGGWNVPIDTARQLRDWLNENVKD